MQLKLGMYILFKYFYLPMWTCVDVMYSQIFGKFLEEKNFLLFLSLYSKEGGWALSDHLG